MSTRNSSSFWYVLVRWRWNDTELLHHAQIIPHRPMFDPLAVPEAHEMHLGLPNRATGRSDPYEKAEMGPAQHHTTNNGVPHGYQLLDGEVQIGKGGAQHRDHLARWLGTAIIHAGRHLMIDAVGGDQLACD